MFWLMLFVANYSEHDVVIMLPTTYATEPWAHCTHTYSKPRLSRKLKIKSKPCGRGACGQKSMKRPGASWWGKWSLKAVYASRHSHSRRRSLKPSDHWGVSDRRSPPSRPSQPGQPPARSLICDSPSSLNRRLTSGGRQKSKKAIT